VKLTHFVPVLAIVLAASAHALNMKDKSVAENIPKCLESESNCRVGDSTLNAWRAMHTPAGCGFTDVKTPKIVVDDSFVALCQAHNLTSAGTMDQYFNGINGLCAKGDTERKTITGSIKTIRFYALPDLEHPKSAFDGPAPKFDLKDGTLSIGFHTSHENIGQGLAAWLEKNL
jgi:hypothetical protein